MFSMMDSPIEPETEHSDENCLKPDEVFYKTQRCMKFMQGNCTFWSCKFGHGMEELREMSTRSHWLDNHGERDTASGTLGVLQRNGGFNNKRPRICYQWQGTRTCSYGDKCLYQDEHQKHEEEDPKGFENGDLYDWKKSSKPQPGWIPPVLNERDASDFFHAESVDLPIHVAVNTANPVNKVIATSTEKSAEIIYKEKNNAIQVPGCQNKLSRWKGPQKITRIYGDWIDE